MHVDSTASGARFASVFVTSYVFVCLEGGVCVWGMSVLTCTARMIDSMIGLLCVNTTGRGGWEATLWQLTHKIVRE